MLVRFFCFSQTGRWFLTKKHLIADSYLVRTLGALFLFRCILCACFAVFQADLRSTRLDQADCNTELSNIIITVQLLMSVTCFAFFAFALRGKQDGFGLVVEFANSAVVVFVILLPWWIAGYLPSISEWQKKVSGGVGSPRGVPVRKIQRIHFSVSMLLFFCQEGVLVPVDVSDRLSFHV